MKLPPIASGPSGSAKPTHPAAQALSALLKSLPTGAELQGRILAFESLTSKNKASLLEALKTLESQVKPNILGSEPGKQPPLFERQTGVARLQQLLKENTSGVVRVLLQGREASLLTDRPLPTGTQIKVTLRADGHLTLRSVDAAPNTSIPPPVPKPVIDAVIRQHIPHARPLAGALQTVIEWQTNTSRSKASVSQSWQTAIAQQVRTLLVNSLDWQQPLNANDIRRAIRNGGTLLETKFREQLQIDTAPQNRPTRSDARPADVPTSATTLPGSKVDLGDRSPNRPEADSKANWLRLAALALPLADNSAHITSRITAGGKDRLERLFKQLLGLRPEQSSILPKQGHSRKNGLSNPKNATLVSAAFSALSRITLLQAQQLGRQAEGLGQGVQVDIPLRIHDQLFPLFLQIRQLPDEHDRSGDKSQEQAEDTKREASQQRRWEVFMRLELDALGHLSCRLCCDGVRVSTELWMSEKTLWHSAKLELHALKDRLESSGIEVEHLACSLGEGPKNPLKISRSLINVTT